MNFVKILEKSEKSSERLFHILNIVAADLQRETNITKYDLRLSLLF